MSDSIGRDERGESVSDFGEFLRQAWAERGMTQRELTKKSGVSVNMIGYIERGESEPTLETARLLLVALGMSYTIGIKKDRTG
ncbi:MAG: helix-turn-helix transcriptional regulator [Schwartzia sp.]|nr:helix-turn-helix transcriptional regulator [Schwartzia sp. (in: firmicutes)]